jgi:hypothetical protein
MPHSANSRPIPFALRDQVREQIQAMLKDGILEESHSAYFNPVTLVVHEGKAVRICLGARRINKQIIYKVNKLLIVVIKHNNNIIIINLFIMGSHITYIKIYIKFFKMLEVVYSVIFFFW